MRRIRGAPATGTVQTEHAEVLRGEVVRDEYEVSGRKCHHAFRARKGQRVVRREKDREAGCGNRNRDDHEAHWLGTQQRPVGCCRVGQPRRTETVTDPEQGSEAEDQQIERALAGIFVAMRKQQRKRRQPER